MSWSWYEEPKMKYYVVLHRTVMVDGELHAENRCLYNKAGTKPKYFASEAEAIEEAIQEKYSMYPSYSICLDSK